MGIYPPVGLFSTAHIISIVICFVLIAVAVVFTRHMTSGTYTKLCRVFAIVLTCLELFKIMWTWSCNIFGVNSWVPLYFCSLFIYALWCMWSKRQLINDLGRSYIAMAGIIAGVIFIISPSTSFSTYPIWHFQCIYSMVYHSIMVYCGVMIFVTKSIQPTMKSVGKYCLFCSIFMILAIFINILSGGNLMFLANPAGVPLPFLKSIHNASQILYTTLLVVAHMAMGFVVLGVYKLCTLRTRIEPDEEEVVEKHT